MLTCWVIPSPAGPLLNLTARILSKAAPGQILTDESTWQLIKTGQENDNHSLVGVNLGEFGLKGVATSMCLYQVSDEVN
jgi:class 3 adenylate cyclase